MRPKPQTSKRRSGGLAGGAVEQRSSRRLTLSKGQRRAACVLLGLVALVLYWSSAALAERHTYSSTCQIAGSATGYRPALSFKPAARTFHFNGSGTCTGSMDGHRKLETIKVVTSIRGKTTVDSCAGFGITEHAAGILRGIGSSQARAVRVSFLTDILIDGLTVTTATIGKNGGAALGSGMIHPDANTIAGCAHGRLERLRFTITMHTVTPFVIDPAPNRHAGRRS